MLPHDPDIATPHTDSERREYGDDGFAVSDRRTVRTWIAVVAILVTTGLVFGLGWLLVADDEDETGEVTSMAPVAVVVHA